ncbi:MAG TPA: ribosome maturation factor RimP [Polyangiaceae bacterium]|nr:ribosome maturation factor RimP [Polyangiaceae bacterium]
MVQLFAQKLKGINRAPLEAAVTPVLSAHGVGTAEISYQMEPSGWVLRVVVESLEDAPVAAEPIHLGLLTEISRDLSSALDVADVIPHRYSLEVSSPGLERPLRSARDYHRSLGQVAKVYLTRPAPDGQRVLRGRILEAEGESVRLEVDGKFVTAELGEVERAHLIFELPANPKGGRPKAGKHQRD